MTHFSLGNGALLVLVNELHRILDGHDVFGVRLVDPIDDRRQGGGFAGTGWTGDQHQPLLQLGEGAERRRNGELLERLDLFGDDPKDGSRAVLLVEKVGAKATYALERVGEVQVQGPLVMGPLGVGRHFA